MTDRITVKIQRDVTGTSILISEEPDGTPLWESAGHEARMIADRYGLGPMGKTWARAEVDGNGLLHLGDELEAP